MSAAPKGDIHETAGAKFNESLWQSFAHSVRDTFIAEFAVQGLRIGGVIVLARVLQPHDFGLLKVLVVASAFVSLTCEGGIPDALIQRKELRDEHEATAWWLAIVLAAVSAGALYLLAPIISAAMAMPPLTFGLRLMCVPLLLEGTATIANARLRRELRFGALAVADVLGEIAFLLAAFVLLWRSLPQWSLAGGLAARLTVHALTIWTLDSRVPLGRPSISAARDLSRFALSACGGKLITVASGNADYLMVGRLLGSGALGFYAMAWDLLRFVPDRLYRVAGRVAMPTFCRLQDDDQELARAYWNFVAYIGRVILPIAACVALAAPEFLSSIYGEKWLPAAAPMRLLVGGLALVGLRIGIGCIYYTKDYPSFDIYLNGLRLLLLVTVIAAVFGSGLLAVSAGVSLTEASIGLAGQYLVCALINLRFRDLVGAVKPGLRLAAVCLLATAAGKVIGMFAGIRSPMVLALVAIPPAIAFCWMEAGDVSQMIGQAFAKTIRKAPDSSEDGVQT